MLHKFLTSFISDKPQTEVENTLTNISRKYKYGNLLNNANKQR